MHFVLAYLELTAVIIIVAVSATWATRRRRLRATAFQPSPGFIRTDEVFIDPTTGVKQQVWYNPQTGERQYETITGPK